MKEWVAPTAPIVGSIMGGAVGWASASFFASDDPQAFLSVHIFAAIIGMTAGLLAGLALGSRVYKGRQKSAKRRGKASNSRTEKLRHKK
jgi:membrane associated rhomboid family serine protease